MVLSANIAVRSTLLSPLVAMVTSPDTSLNVLRRGRKIASLSLKSLLILMVLCVIGSTLL
jgi:hypothetical protein